MMCRDKVALYTLFLELRLFNLFVTILATHQRQYIMLCHICLFMQEFILQKLFWFKDKGINQNC